MKSNKSIFGLVNIYIRSNQDLAAFLVNLEEKIGRTEESVTLLNVRALPEKDRGGFNVTTLVLIHDGEDLPKAKTAIVQRAVNAPVKSILFDAPGNANIECVEFAPTLIDALRLDKKQLQRPGSKGLKLFEQASNDPWKSRDARRRQWSKNEK